MSAVLLAFGLAVDILHVHLEVIVPGELLVAQLAFGHGPVGVVGEFVPDQHLLQTEGQVTHLYRTGQMKIEQPMVTRVANKSVNMLDRTKATEGNREPLLG